jgi:hypothetical protein
VYLATLGLSDSSPVCALNISEWYVAVWTHLLHLGTAGEAYFRIVIGHMGKAFMPPLLRSVIAIIAPVLIDAGPALG